MEHFYEQIQGFFNFPGFYTMIAQRMPDQSVMAEVGVWKGTSLFYLAVELHNQQKHVTIYAVDTWQGSPEHFDLIKQESPEDVFDKWLAQWQSEYVTVVKVKRTSLEAAMDFRIGPAASDIDFVPVKFDFVFIDASHAYYDVLADITAWQALLKPEGVLAGHDYTWSWPGVRRAVDELIPLERVRHDGTVWWRS